MQNEFKVTVSKKYDILLYIFFFMTEVLCIIRIFDPKTMLAGILSSVYIFAFCFFVQFCSFMFYVKVKGLTIKVRTKLGKKYEFRCSDIDKVICSSRLSIKAGPIYYITIITELHQLDMKMTMDGSGKMARYIIEKHNNGEIKKTAVSESCKRELYNYERRV